MNILKTENLSKDYYLNLTPVTIIKDANLNINEGEFIAIKGESGSGKTTLLNLLAGFLKPTKGNVFINNSCINSMNESQKAVFRRKNIGFVFQNYELLEELNVQENVILPLLISNVNKNEAIQKVKDAIKCVGLENYSSHSIKELSGGQKQRIAIARAIVNNPKIIFADEPTGNLDSKNKVSVLETFKKINLVFGTTIIMVTHSEFDMQYANRVILVKDGEIK